MGVLKRSWCIAILAALPGALMLAPARGQVVASAYGPAHALWAGAEYSYFNASFPYQSGQRIGGVGVFADYHVTPIIAVEGDAQFLPFGGFHGVTESSFLAGPKAFFLARGRFRPYGKALVGVGNIHYPFAIGNANYLSLAPGAGTEYSIGRRWSLRGEYEYQMWLNSPGYVNEPNHELTPNGFHIGLAYRIFR